MTQGHKKILEVDDSAVILLVSKRMTEINIETGNLNAEIDIAEASIKVVRDHIKKLRAEYTELRKFLEQEQKKAEL